MSLPRAIALSDEEIDDVMTDQWNLRIATIGPGTKINLTPHVVRLGSRKD